MVVQLRAKIVLFGNSVGAFMDRREMFKSAAEQQQNADVK